MWHFPLKRARSAPALSCARLFTLFGVMLLISALLVACGGSTTAQSARPKPTATATATPTPSPTPTIAPTPTPVPTQPPAPTQPPPPPPPGPPPVSNSAILDLTPASMSFVGHLDCQNTGAAYVCHARVFSRASNPGSLQWTSFVNFANNVTFSPGSGIVAPGHSVDVFISIPIHDCGVRNALFFFKGPMNTHTITWAC